MATHSSVLAWRIKKTMFNIVFINQNGYSLSGLTVFFILQPFLCNLQV